MFYDVLWRSMMYFISFVDFWVAWSQRPRSGPKSAREGRAPGQKHLDLMATPKSDGLRLNMTENDHKSLVLHLYIISYNYIYIYIHTCHYIAMISQFVWLGTPIFDQKPTGSWLGSNVWAQKFKTKHSRRTTPNIGGQPAKRQKMCLFLFMALPSIVGFPVQGSTGISSNMSQLSLLPRRCLLDPLGGPFWNGCVPIWITAGNRIINLYHLGMVYPQKWWFWGWFILGFTKWYPPKMATLQEKVIVKAFHHLGQVDV